MTFMEAFARERHRFEAETGYKPTCMFVSANLLREQEAMLTSHNLLVTVDPSTKTKTREIGGLPVFTVVEPDIIRACL